LISLVSTKAFEYQDAPPQAITAPHTPVPFSPPLEDYYIPSVDKIVAAVKTAVSS
jgi:pyruvate dehydrogenase E1 component beta subunit